ncbi:hypothetical protein LIER_10318 [Lithospermum erythrorhizon]|uniref:Uncharacterized protein n=1 Tax=Lithospermum erythrorhizon TaxID=34254 RepID=A0AAV3PL44_LITER
MYNNSDRRIETSKLTFFHKLNLPNLRIMPLLTMRIMPLLHNNSPYFQVLDSELLMLLDEPSPDLSSQLSSELKCVAWIMGRVFLFFVPNQRSSFPWRMNDPRESSFRPECVVRV